MISPFNIPTAASDHRTGGFSRPGRSHRNWTVRNRPSPSSTKTIIKCYKLTQHLPTNLCRLKWVTCTVEGGDLRSRGLDWVGSWTPNQRLQREVPREHQRKRPRQLRRAVLRASRGGGEAEVVAVRCLLAAVRRKSPIIRLGRQWSGKKTSK